MRLQLNEPQLQLKGQMQKKNKDVTFTSGAAIAAGVLRQLEANPTVGATAVDVGAMVAPRTIIDMKRNPFAGIETFFREIAGVTVHACIGLFGLGAATLFKNKLAKDYDVDFRKILSDTDSIENLAKNWDNACKQHGYTKQAKEQIVETYLKNSFSKVEGLSESQWKSLSSSKKQIINELKASLLDESVDKMPKAVREKMVNFITGELGVNRDLRVTTAEGKKLTTDAVNMIDDVFTMGRSFMSDKVMRAFESAKGELDNNGFIKLLGNSITKKTLIGLTAVSAIGASVQAVNRYLTEKRTGSEGFVGYSDFEANAAKSEKTEATESKETKKSGKDKSFGFKMMKFTAAAAMVALAVKSIGKPKDLLKNVQFKGVLPTLNQFKAIYGATITGRLLAASDKNELRETATRDYLGFINWLILGNVVAMAVVNKLDPSLISLDVKKHSDTLWNRLTKGRMTSYDEITDSVLKNKSLSKAGERLGMRDIFKKLSSTKIGKEAIKKMAKLNVANAAGLLYSCLALGIIVPKMNEYITERSRAKEKAEAQKNAINQNAESPIFTNRQRMNQDIKKLYSAFMK